MGGGVYVFPVSCGAIRGCVVFAGQGGTYNSLAEALTTGEQNDVRVTFVTEESASPSAFTEMFIELLQSGVKDVMQRFVCLFDICESCDAAPSLREAVKRDIGLFTSDVAKWTIFRAKGDYELRHIWAVTSGEAYRWLVWNMLFVSFIAEQTSDLVL